MRKDSASKIQATVAVAAIALLLQGFSQISPAQPAGTAAPGRLTADDIEVSTGPKAAAPDALPPQTGEPATPTDAAPPQEESVVPLSAAPAAMPLPKGDDALPSRFEQRNNPFITKSQPFYYFFVRKVMLFYTAQAYVYFPGGFGTLDEFFELVTLIQTHKIDRDSVPLILVGKEFWGPLVQYINDTVYEQYQAIDKEDMQLYHLVDTAEEAYKLIKASPPRKEIYY